VVHLNNLKDKGGKKMGSSPSIADLQKQNDEFSKYIANATKNLKERSTLDQNTFEQNVTSFYGQNKWDQQPIAGGSFMNYHQEAEFSLDSIKATLNSVADSIFTNNSPPSGTTVDKVVAVAKIVTEIMSYEALALSAAQGFVLNILGAFDTSISSEYHSIVKSQSLAPGLMLHAWNFGDAFHQSDYFNNEFIVENAINFKLIYSFAQAAMEQDIGYKLIEDQETQIEKMQQKMDQLTLDPETEQKKITDYQARIDGVKNQLEEYRKEVDKVIKKYGDHS
jgi:hypothetical protein